MTFSKETIRNSIQGIGVKIADFLQQGLRPSLRNIEKVF